MKKKISNQRDIGIVPPGIIRTTQGTCLRGDGEFVSSYCNRIRTYLDALASRSEVSFRWYTHTNPAGCWICDTFLIAYALLRELAEVGEFLSSESVDGRQSDGKPSEEEVLQGGDAEEDSGELGEGLNGRVHCKDS